MARRFQKRIESFECQVCRAQVVGDGYTNHCPHCLWSLHCDQNPGDRAETCHGLMEPISIELKGQTKIIIHRCQQCGLERPNRASEQDSLDAIIAVIEKRK